MRPQLFTYYRWLFLFLAAGLCLLPLWATFIGGFKTTGDLRTNALGLPKQWVSDNYLSILHEPRFWQMLGNSSFIAFFTVLLVLIISSMAAFTFAHLRFAGKRFIAGYRADLSFRYRYPSGFYPCPGPRIAGQSVGCDSSPGRIPIELQHRAASRI